MTPASSAAARRTAAARPAPGRSAPAPAPRRPPLRVFEPAPRTRRRTRRRPTVLLAGVLVVGSLLAVVVADDMVAQSQVRLSNVEQQVAADTVNQKQLQVAVATLAAPQAVVTQAESQLGLVAPSQVVDLPQVPLNVALPAPDTTPLPGSPPASTTAGSTAGTTAGTTAAGSTPAGSTPAASTPAGQ